MFVILVPSSLRDVVGRAGGHSLPGDGFPPPSLSGLALKPDRTISSLEYVSSRSLGTGFEVGLSDVCLVSPVIPAGVPSLAGHAFRMIRPVSRWLGGLPPYPSGRRLLSRECPRRLLSNPQAYGHSRQSSQTKKRNKYAHPSQWATETTNQRFLQKKSLKQRSLKKKL